MRRRRALVVESPGTIRVTQLPALDPGPDEVVIRPAYCGVCRTDLELLRGEVDPAYVRYPLTLGHEWSGTIEAVGADVEGLTPGDRCVAECIVPCGRCRFCQAGETNVCELYEELGFTREGGASDQVLVPSRLVHKLAPSTSLLDAALVEPCSVVLRALDRGGPKSGDRVLVVGDGTIGLLAAYLVSLWSPSEVRMLGRRPEQAQLAKSVGVAAFGTAADDHPGTFDLVIEAAGVSEAVATSIGAVRRGGVVVLLGLPPTEQTLELRADLLVNNDLTVAASFGYTSRDWARMVDLVNARRVNPGRIVTHRFPLEDSVQAFAALGSLEGRRGKILLEIAGEDH
jgi:2-desacetyl-2-hydroxyethyl bacteriochlorophyllide A dehydrogenase